MSRQNSHVRINQSSAKVRIDSIENLNADQICGSRGNFQSIPERQVADIKSGRSNNLPNPRRSIEIRVNPNQDSNNLQYNLLENPKNSNTNSIAEVVGDFVEAVIASFFGTVFLVGLFIHLNLCL
jgi:hypothetical protein